MHIKWEIHILDTKYYTLYEFAMNVINYKHKIQVILRKFAIQSRDNI